MSGLGEMLGRKLFLFFFKEIRVNLFISGLDLESSLGKLNQQSFWQFPLFLS